MLSCAVSHTSPAFTAGLSTHAPHLIDNLQRQPARVTRPAQLLRTGLNAAEHATLAGALLVCASAVRMLCMSAPTKSRSRHVVKCTAPQMCTRTPLASSMDTISVSPALPPVVLAVSAPVLSPHTDDLINVNQPADVACAAKSALAEMPIAAASAVPAFTQRAKLSGARWIGGVRRPAARSPGRTARAASATAQAARRTSGAKLLSSPPGEVPVCSYDPSRIRLKLQCTLNVLSGTQGHSGRESQSFAGTTASLQGEADLLVRFAGMTMLHKRIDTNK